MIDIHKFLKKLMQYIHKLKTCEMHWETFGIEKLNYLTICNLLHSCIFIFGPAIKLFLVPFTKLLQCQHAFLLFTISQGLEKYYNYLNKSALRSWMSRMQSKSIVLFPISKSIINLHIPQFSSNSDDQKLNQSPHLQLRRCK